MEIWQLLGHSQTSCHLILTSGVPLVVRPDLKALILAGPTVTRLVPDPLTELSLDNQLYLLNLLVQIKKDMSH